MDGTSRKVLHNSNIVYPYALTLDYGTQTLYWADYSLDVMESSYVDGTNRVQLLGVTIQTPLYLTIFAGRLYWSDTSLNVLLSTPVRSPANVTTLTSYLSNDPYGVQVVSEGRQPRG